MSRIDDFLGAADDSGDETLHEGDWLSLKVRRGDYEYAHEERSDGEIVAVLPFRLDDRGNVDGFLLRVEECLAWGEGQVPCALTGGVETENPAIDAARELHEESGYEVPPHDLVSLGKSRATKAMDTVYHLWSANLTGLEPGEAEGDGTAHEERGTTMWTDDIRRVADPHVHVMWSRLVHRFSA